MRLKTKIASVLAASTLVVTGVVGLTTTSNTSEGSSKPNVIGNKVSNTVNSAFTSSDEYSSDIVFSLTFQALHLTPGQPYRLQTTSGRYEDDPVAYTLGSQQVYASRSGTAKWMLDPVDVSGQGKYSICFLEATVYTQTPEGWLGDVLIGTDGLPVSYEVDYCGLTPSPPGP